MSTKMGKNSKRILVIWMIISLLIPGYIAVAEEVTVRSMEILTMPEITEYCIGDQIMTKGLSLLLTYESDETKVITDDYEVLYDFSTEGTKEVTVNYEENGRLFTVNYFVTVYEKPLLSIESQKVEKGEVFSVPVQIEKNCGLMGFDIQVIYDQEYLEPIEVIPSELLGNEIINDSIAVSSEDYFHIIWAGTENMKSDGELFRVLFMLKPTAPNDTTEIRFTPNQENTYNEQYHTVSIDPCMMNVTPVMKTGVKKKSLDGLSVSMDGWVSGERVSTPVLVGNSGNGSVVYTYSNQIDGNYTEELPVKPGRYYLRATVSETDEYFGGVATCTFEIIEKSLDNPPEKTPDNSPEKTPDNSPEKTPNNFPNNSNNGEKISGYVNYNNQEIKDNKMIIPKVKKIKNQKKRKVKITLSKKISDISGYEIQYATKKNFKNASVVTVKGKKTILTIKGLKKKKKYYIRVRSYKNKGSVIYYSKWSSRRQIKIKK